MADTGGPTTVERIDPAAITGFPVVGLGASAGGLAAFEEFFSGVPAHAPTGMAFVLVQHLAPDHESRLVDLVRRRTTMEVHEVEDGMTVEPDHVYVIPPARTMTLRGGRLRLQTPREPRGHRLPVDVFFRSLAEDQGEKAMCVVLAGTGSDGTLGVREVKGCGGLVLAQDPETIEYGGMPRNAIATGMVDHVLTPAEMPARLLRYAGRDPHVTPPGPGAVSAGDEGALDQVFKLVRTRSGRDFTHYKRNSIRRRVERRMAVQQIGSLEEYARYLEEAPEESEALFRDFLIGVTRFFRDPEAFAALAETGIPLILQDRQGGSTVRVWVPGCSTGEEAYSIAILMRERMVAAKVHAKLQVFATDIDKRAIETARSGTYPASIAEDVSAERLERFFTSVDGGASYRIRKDIRDLLVFSDQDLVSDPPFFRLDLISCRNVLIYMGAELQRKLIPLFHFALSPGGILFLGSSETVGGHADLFTTLDRTAKLYRNSPDRPGAVRQALGPLAAAHRRRPPAPVGEHRATPGKDGAGPSLRERVEHELLAHHAPVAVLVDARGEILYLHGRSGRFLEPAAGEVGMNILSMARDGLRQELTIALHQAVTHDGPVHRGDLRVQTNGHRVPVRLTVRALSTGPADGARRDLYLVVLDTDPGEAAPGRTRPRRVAGGDPEAPGGEPVGAGGGTDSRVAVLEDALRAKEEYLQAVQEEMQASNEELRASIEELQSTNEELQSTNEELETSKEELQSVNEELATINTELETKVTDLSRVENDMNNLLAGTGIGTVFVDHTLRIQRFTPAATELLNLIAGDVGRPVGHLTSRLVAYDRLAEDTEAVLDTLVPREVEVRTEAGVWYLLRIRPYRTLENVIEGAVITFTEITELKEARATLEGAAAERRLAVVVRDANDAVTIQDLDGRIRAWNPAAVRIYGWTEDEAIGMSSLELAPPDTHEENRAMLACLAAGEAPDPFRTRRSTKDGRVIPVWVTATALVDEAGKAYALATTERVVGVAVPEEAP
ncbi:MAG: chemotaxis protein CheB [Longimicrobiales bacterium]|nr:chemotaxis protein CheB [Longimicrobiales bacterium]